MGRSGGDLHKTDRIGKFVLSVRSPINNIDAFAVNVRVTLVSLPTVSENNVYCGQAHIAQYRIRSGDQSPVPAGPIQNGVVPSCALGIENAARLIGPSEFGARYVSASYACCSIIQQNPRTLIRFVFRGYLNSKRVFEAKRTGAVCANRELAAAALQLSALDNGFRVVSESNGRATATVGVWIECGSRFEDDSNNGTAHFLEHMIYHGTGKRSAIEVEESFQKIGARFGSYTSREHSAFYVQCASKHVENALELLADVLRNSKLDQAVMERERSRILLDLEKLSENANEVAFDYLHDAAFQGTPMAKSAYGTTENIRKMKSSDLRKYAERNYKPLRMILSAVGNVEHSKLIKLAEKHFGDLTNDQSASVSDEGIRFTGSEFIYRNDNIPFMYGALAVEGVAYKHPSAVPLKIASMMIGDWDCTQLSSSNAPTAVAQKISTGYGVHQLRSFSINYKDCGLFGFSIVMDGNDVMNTTFGMKEVTRGWKRLAIGVSDEEVERGKNMYKTVAFSALESNIARADDIAKQVLYSGSVMSLSDLENAINDVDKAAISKAMNEHVYDRDLAVAGVGRTEAWPDYYQMRIGMSSWRL